MTLTLEVFCRSNLFVFERHCNGVSKDQAQRQYDNKLWNNKLKNEKNDKFYANFLFLWPWPWPLVDNLGSIVLFSERQFNVQQISKVRSKNL